MRQLLALLATALLGVSAAACDSAGKGAGAVSTPPPSSNNTGTAGGAAATVPVRIAQSGSYPKDSDKDGDDKRHPANAENDDRTLFAAYAGRASPADRRAVTILVNRYYTAAAAGDAAKACSLLSSSLAAGLATSQGHSGQGDHNTCAGPMSLLIRQQHQRLIADDVTTMVVTSVYMKGDQGLAVLSFKAMPEATIAVEREGHAWKVGALLDSGLM
jgi:hypothetical protein